MTLKQHIEQLARQHGATVLWAGQHPRGRYQSAIDMSDGTLYLGVDFDEMPEEAYWVALHELGHWATGERLDNFLALLDKTAMMHTPAYSEHEAKAWAWALDNALPEAYPLGQAAQSSIAWSTADYMHGHGWEPSPAYERIYRALGPDPDWFNDVTTEAHYAKLDGWARPMWAELAAHYDRELATV